MSKEVKDIFKNIMRLARVRSSKKIKKFLEKNINTGQNLLETIHHIKRLYPMVNLGVEIDEDDEGQFASIFVQIDNNILSNKKFVQDLKKQLGQWDNNIKIIDAILDENIPFLT